MIKLRPRDEYAAAMKTAREHREFSARLWRRSQDLRRDGLEDEGAPHYMTAMELANWSDEENEKSHEIESAWMLNQYTDEATADDIGVAMRARTVYFLTI